MGRLSNKVKWQIETSINVRTCLDDSFDVDQFMIDMLCDIENKHTRLTGPEIKISQHNRCFMICEHCEMVKWRMHLFRNTPYVRTNYNYHIRGRILHKVIPFLVQMQTWES